MSPDTPAYQPDSTRRLVGVMFTDIVGYATKASTDEVVSFHLVQEHNKLLSDIISSYKGEIVKTIGDAVMGRFQSVVRAVECALDIQKALQEFNAGKKESEHLHLRIGVHAGDVLETSDSDLFGHDVNIAARLEPLAEPGSVIITDTVHSLIRGKTNLTFNLLGDFELKNIPTPIRLYIVTHTDESTVLEPIAEDSTTPKKRVVGHYQILEKIGEGGMGEVWLADDTTLDRKVALKFLSEELQRDPTSKKRFLREAKSAAALDHPYICNIFQVGEEDGISFIAMEYVQGQTLKDKLSEGPLPLKEAIKTAAEIAEALEKAHQEGILHRDLKPANIMLTSEGHVKVMDFGLAKQIMTPEKENGEDLTASLTQEGMTPGTLAYMSPEQIRGEPLDARSDLFPLGIMLYEMLSGVHPFRKDVQVATAAAILSEEPLPITEYIPKAPDLLQRIIETLLEKELEYRYHPTSELKADLTDLLEGSIARKGLAIWLPATIVSVSLMLIVGGYLLISGNKEIASTFTASPFLVTTSSWLMHASWSPSGHLIAYEQDEDIWVCDSTGKSNTNLTKDFSWPARYPAFSPDGQRIAFLSDRDGTGIFTMTVLGGDVQKVVGIVTWEANVFRLTWENDNRLYYSAGGGAGADQDIYSISPNGDNLICLTENFPRIQCQQNLSPSSRLLIFKSGWDDICVLNLRSGKLDTLSCKGWWPLWNPSGREILFTSLQEANRDLWSVRVNPRTGAQIGEPYRRSTALDIEKFYISPDGQNILVSSRYFHGNIWRLTLDPLTGTSLQGVKQLTTNATYDLIPRWIPGANAFVYNTSSNRRVPSDISIMKLGDQIISNITQSSDVSEGRPIVSPDGQWIAFLDDIGDDTHPDIPILIRPDGSDRHELHPRFWEEYGSLIPNEHLSLEDWSPNGKDLAVSAGLGRGIGVVQMNPNNGIAEGLEWLLDNGSMPRWSPDGRYLAYQGTSRSHRTPDIYVVDNNANDKRRILSGYLLGWSSNPSYLYYNRIDEGEQIELGVWRIQMNASGIPIGEPQFVPQIPTESIWLDIEEHDIVYCIPNVGWDFWMLGFPEK
ncbi:MAG: protein kinase [Candidatus Latescibacteria bacterium]|nr:protein kinase [Candidatus Latescibacterota bacterium]